MLEIHHKKRFSKNAGFTLIELMVSIAIFAIVMTISTSTLLVLIDMNAKAQALYSATSNISFALDSMSREIRTGYYYYCSATAPSDLGALPIGSTDGGGNPCASGGGKVIVFTRERDGVRIGYKHEERPDETKVIERKEGNGDWIAITAEEVVIDGFDITVQDAETYQNAGNNIDQPKVDLLISGYVSNGLDTDTDFNIQTRLVGRRLDII